MNEYERDSNEDRVTIKDKLSYWPTGGGLLVFRIREEFDPNFDNEFIVDRQLVGVAEVEDKKVVQDILKIYGYDPEIIDDLPVYPYDGPE